MKNFFTVVSCLALTVLASGKGNDKGNVEEKEVISPATLFSTSTNCSILPVGCVGVFEIYEPGQIGKGDPVKTIKIVEWEPAPDNEKDCFEMVSKKTLALADEYPNNDVMGVGSFD